MDGERDCSRKQRPKHEQWNESSARVLVVRDILTCRPFPTFGPGGLYFVAHTYISLTD
jgi:hypothetical protein